MDVRQDSQVELFRAVPASQLAETRELHGISPSFLGEVIYLIYASYGKR